VPPANDAELAALQAQVGGSDAYIFNFQDNGTATIQATGTANAWFGNVEFSWLINPAGEIELSLITPAFILDAGTTTGVWITLTRDGANADMFRYTNGSGSLDNGDFSIISGAGVTAPNATTGLESVFQDRVWNGRIYYNTR